MYKIVLKTIVIIINLAILPNFLSLTNVYAGKHIMQDYEKNSGKNPIDNIWKYVNNLISDKLSYPCNDIKTENILSTLNTTLNKIKDTNKRQNICASLIPSLTAVLQPCTLIELLSNITKNDVVVKTAINASRQYRNKNDKNASREMLSYAETRIHSIDDPQRVISHLLSIAKQFISQSYKQEGQSKLDQVIKYLNDITESK
ncbi:MAG: hypothetical protein OMM_13033, partial [Candidatus Magnetoglobus multicellularis str. Araruama]